jgi:hypothetical protein
VADNLPNAKRVQEVLAHEAIGHAALEAMLGKDLMADLVKNVQNLEKSSRLIKQIAVQVDNTQPGLSDERRAKEAALREREEAVKFAQQIFEENKKLRAGLADNQSQNVELIKAKAGSELDTARRKYKEAQESMDPDQILEAQEALTEAKIRLNQIESYRPAPLQEKEDTVYTESAPQNVNAPDEKATRWQAQNAWFGEDDEMTSFALGVHRKLVNSGIDPRTDVYYERLNARIKEIFPDKFGGPFRNDKKPANVVAPATRTTGAKKVRLTQTQVAFAKRLGVPLQDYAREVAKQMGKDNG